MDCYALRLSSTHQNSTSIWVFALLFSLLPHRCCHYLWKSLVAEDRRKQWKKWRRPETSITTKDAQKKHRKMHKYNKQDTHKKQTRWVLQTVLYKIRGGDQSKMAEVISTVNWTQHCRHPRRSHAPHSASPRGKQAAHASYWRSAAKSQILSNLPWSFESMRLCLYQSVFIFEAVCLCLLDWN